MVVKVKNVECIEMFKNVFFGFNEVFKVIVVEFEKFVKEGVKVLDVLG